jgi:hypothetical protein
MFLAVCSSLSIPSNPCPCFLTFSIAIADYLPIFFQAVRHHTAARSGIDIIPYMLTMVLSLILSAAVVKKSGHYWALLFLGPLYVLPSFKPNIHPSSIISNFSFSVLL